MKRLTNTVGISVIGIFFVLFGLLIMANCLKNPTGKKIQGYLAKHPQITAAQLEQDFSQAKQAGLVWIGKKWTFSHKLNDSVLDNSLVAWVHTDKEQAGRNIHYYVIWNLADGRQEKISLSSAKKCTEVMNSYQGFSHILTGNNLEYNHLLKNSLEEFLNIKYRSGGNSYAR